MYYTSANRDEKVFDDPAGVRHPPPAQPAPGFRIRRALLPRGAPGPARIAGVLRGTADRVSRLQLRRRSRAAAFELQQRLSPGADPALVLVQETVVTAVESSVSSTALPETMKAWQVVRYGSPVEALELARAADAGARARVSSWPRTATSVLNYNEVDGCRGRYLTINPPLPYTLGMEFVGEVIVAGEGAEPSSAAASWASPPVPSVPMPSTSSGRSTSAFDVPEELDDTRRPRSTSPSISRISACTSGASSKPGETVLIHAAAGGVGSAAVQLAVAAGARVIATAGWPEKLEFARGSRRRRRHQLSRTASSRPSRGDRRPGRRRLLRRRRR